MFVVAAVINGKAPICRRHPQCQSESHYCRGHGQAAAGKLSLSGLLCCTGIKGKNTFVPNSIFYFQHFKENFKPCSDRICSLLSLGQNGIKTSKFFSILFFFSSSFLPVQQFELTASWVISWIHIRTFSSQVAGTLNNALSNITLRVPHKNKDALGPWIFIIGGDWS